MRRKDGEVRDDYDFELDEIILDVIFKKKHITADRIRKIINEKYNRKLGWVTIKRHVDYLIKKEKIKIYYENEEGKKKIRLYEII